MGAETNKSEKIKLSDLLNHVVQQRHRYDTMLLFDFGESTGLGGTRTARCKMVTDRLNDNVRETIRKMEEVTLCVLGQKLSVGIYTRHIPNSEDQKNGH